MSKHPLHDIRISRRTTIKWLAATMATAHAGCSGGNNNVGAEIPPLGSNASLLGTATAPTGERYGTDPDVMNPSVPWSRTMTDAQLELATSLADVILPADEQSPAASSVGVVDFIDEWISAPYEYPRNDRPHILEGLEWLQRQSLEMFATGFASATAEQKTQLIDPLAYPGDRAGELKDQVEFFRRFRFLAVGAFYSSDVGARDVGYVGNVAIAGDYPGPSDAAMAHLESVLETLNLSLLP